MNREVQINEYLDNAWFLRSRGEYIKSKKHLKSALDLCQDNDFSYLGRINHIYMQYEADHQDFEKAIHFCQIALSYYRKADIPDRIAHSMRHLADLQLELNLLDESKQNYLEAIEIYNKLKESNDGDMANALRGYCNCLERTGLFDQCVDFWRRILIIYEENNFQSGIKEAKDKIARLEKKTKKQ